MISTPGRTPAATNVDWTGRAAASETPLAKSRLSAASRRSARRSAARNLSHAIKDPRDVTHNELVAKLGDPEADHVIGHRFLFVKRLGQGSYGSVVQAMDRCTGREVAIKVIVKAKANPVLPRRHTEGTEPAEFALTCRCRHPNVVEVYEWAESDLSVFLVMELVRGDALVDYLEALPELLTEQQAMLIVWQLLAALAHLAQNHVVHRDIKPNNIMIDIKSNGLPVFKLIDFGLAKDLLAFAPTAAANVSTYDAADAANDDQATVLVAAPVAIAEPPAVVAAAFNPINESAADNAEPTSPDAVLATKPTAAIGAGPSPAPITLKPATVLAAAPANLVPPATWSGGKGSLDWMAPESVMPAWHVPGYSTRIDTWAVGAVLFWLTIGFTPFEGFCEEEEEEEGDEKMGGSEERKGEDLAVQVSFKEAVGRGGRLEVVPEEGVDSDVAEAAVNLDANVSHGIERALDKVAPLDSEQLVENNEALVMLAAVEDNEAVCDLSQVAAQEQVHHVESESGVRGEEEAGKQVGDKDAANGEQAATPQPNTKAELEAEAEAAAELETDREAVIRRICTVDYPRRVFFEPGDGNMYDFLDARPNARRLIAALLVLDPRNRPSASQVLAGTWFADVKAQYGQLYQAYCDQFSTRHINSPATSANTAVDLNVATPTPPPPPMLIKIPVVFPIQPPASPLASTSTLGVSSSPSTIPTTHMFSSCFWPSVALGTTPAPAGPYSLVNASLSPWQSQTERLLRLVRVAIGQPKYNHIKDGSAVNLTTIEARLCKREYTNADAFCDDLDAMVAYYEQLDVEELPSAAQSRRARQWFEEHLRADGVEFANKRQRIADANTVKVVGGDTAVGEEAYGASEGGKRKRE